MNPLAKLSIKSLHMFSVVSRHDSFAAAANELCISVSALSHQMTRLEQALGRSLFFKTGRQQKVLPEVISWVSDINKSFINIEQSTHAFINGGKSEITLGVPSALAFNRVTPALGLWQLDNDKLDAKLDVRIKMLNCGDDPEQHNLDVYLGDASNSTHYTSERLVNEKYLAVCHPQLLDSLANDLSSESLLNKLPLLELDKINTWQTWSEYHLSPHNKLNLTNMRYFSHSILLLQAALSGQGVALLEQALIKPQLDVGTLTALPINALEIDGLALWLSIRKTRCREANIEQLVHWLQGLFTSE